MSESSTNNGIRRQTILAIEDEVEIGDFLIGAIEQETPYRVLHVTDAVQALKAVHSLKPSLFILDYHLPGIDGLELADQLHSMHGLDTVPTLMISSNPPPHQALQERHIVLLEKPFDLIDLLKVIDTLLPKPGA